MDIDTVRVTHFMPGRVRLRMEDIKGSPETADWVQSILEGVQGIQPTEVSTVTGSVLLTYDRRALLTEQAAESLGEALCTLFPDLNVARLLVWLVSLTK
ncbi:HMA2 domain-containing protein [Thiohalorhabdus sp. Cl-TMA]|uniref:HMA2 domain-containing protein n=1 Tax=Thiohalorhabdus methylotrophus TaxID=3242694 RepID=A0ABV4TSJ5_9GAMM